ncbi:uncharacterized protein JN550_009540 [Neoarthrinium moseri]|uniref:uncharacterized protein n=1 Tax=Neoarthrinium moseri TaxID=1658444 RepID=UPI001FDC32F9|nr:uncharacterized protein JN550_009540 [Neoarthrinium moseri]KAI1863429.1 hypothetical protein JN550_009540 [Neoarthrinium moseri]
MDVGRGNPPRSNIPGLQTGIESRYELPLRNTGPSAQYAETVIQSETTIGNSFSTPTEASTSTRPPQTHSIASDLSGIHGVAGTNAGPHSDRMVQLIIPEEDHSEVQSEGRQTPIYPWKFEFTWNSDHLLFANEPLDVKEDLASELADIISSVTVNAGDSRRTAHDTAPFEDVNDAKQMTHDADFRFPPGFESVEDDPLRDALRNDLIADFLHNIDQQIMDILDDHYWRTHTPQRVSGQGRVDRQNGQHSHRSANPYSTAPTRSRALGSSRRQQTSGSEDGDDGDHEQLDSQPSASRSRREFHVDCPFRKRYPRVFALICPPAGFGSISYLTKHLRKAHTTIYCTKCLLPLISSYALFHDCTPYFLGDDKPRTEFLTPKHLARLDEFSNRTHSRDHKWRQIYEIIFPDQDSGLVSPYVSDFARDMERATARPLELWLQKSRAALVQDLCQNLAVEGLIPPPLIVKRFDHTVEKWIIKTINGHLEMKQNSQSSQNHSNLNSNSQSSYSNVTELASSQVVPQGELDHNTPFTPSSLASFEPSISFCQIPGFSEDTSVFTTLQSTSAETWGFQQDLGDDMSQIHPDMLGIDEFSTSQAMNDVDFTPAVGLEDHILSQQKCPCADLGQLCAPCDLVAGPNAEQHAPIFVPGYGFQRGLSNIDFSGNYMSGGPDLGPYSDAGDTDRMYAQPDLTDFAQHDLFENYSMGSL